jgi:type II secretory pathway component PulC
MSKLTDEVASRFYSMTATSIEAERLAEEAVDAIREAVARSPELLEELTDFQTLLTYVQRHRYQLKGKKRVRKSAS